MERSDGTVVDLEAASKLLDYEKPTANITGNNSDQTVYTFSIPSILAGKGVRARVSWQCVSGTGTKTFKWKFGGAVPTSVVYAGYTACSSNDLSYTEIRVFNDPGAQNAQTLLADAITEGTAVVNAGKVATSSWNTATAQSLTFQFNADTNQIIAPKGFIVEVIQ